MYCRAASVQLQSTRSFNKTIKTGFYKLTAGKGSSVRFRQNNSWWCMFRRAKYWARCFRLQPRWPLLAGARIDRENHIWTTYLTAFSLPKVDLFFLFPLFSCLPCSESEQPSMSWSLDQLWEHQQWLVGASMCLVWAGEFLVMNFAHHIQRQGQTTDYGESVAWGVFL